MGRGPLRAPHNRQGIPFRSASRRANDTVRANWEGFRMAGRVPHLGGWWRRFYRAYPDVVHTLGVGAAFTVIGLMAAKVLVF